MLALLPPIIERHRFSLLQLRRAAGIMDEEAAAATPSGGVALTRKTAAEIGGISGHDALK